MTNSVTNSASNLRADLAINKEAEEPIYRQLIRIIRDQIGSGAWHAGDRLPASRDLADELGISRISVVNAYAELRETGILSAHAGRGTFVAGAPYHDGDPRQLPSSAVSHILNGSKPQPGVITFSGGAPAEEFLPVVALRQALNAVLDRDGAMAVAYEEVEGYHPLRQAVVDYLAPWGIQARAEQVLITGGAQQGNDLVVQALCNEGDTLITTNPTYLGILDIARVRRVNVIGVEMDRDGISLEALEQAILTYKPKLIYITPTHHNPTGTVMPIHRRRRLLDLAAAHHVAILEDGVYQELTYEAPPPPPLKALDTRGIVLYVGGYSKIVLPGTRIGYVIATGAIWERILRVKSAADLCTPSLNQRAMHYYLQTGALGGHLDRVRRACKERRDVAVDALRQYMPEGTHWNVPTGGVYLWVQLPKDGPSASELYASAIQHGVTFVVGTLFHSDGGGSYAMRLNFGAQPPDKIREGIRRLGQAWRAWVANEPPLGGTPLL